MSNKTVETQSLLNAAQEQEAIAALAYEQALAEQQTSLIPTSPGLVNGTGKIPRFSELEKNAAELMFSQIALWQDGKKDEVVRNLKDINVAQAWACLVYPGSAQNPNEGQRNDLMEMKMHLLKK